MSNEEAIKMLEEAGLKPTSNRILVLRAILDAGHPQSVTDLETRLETMEKSSVFRVLMQLQDHGIIHSLEDGRGIVKYEICTGHGHCTPEKLHVHFYCEKCHEVTCFEDIPVPLVDLPKEYTSTFVNYMVKGICPKCKK